MESNPASLDELKRRLAQVDALRAEGVLGEEAARQAREQLEQQVLALVAAPLAAPASSTTPPPRIPRPLWLGVSAFVLVVAAAGYAWQGNRAGWSVGPGEDVMASNDPATQQAQIEAMVARLAERLKQKPDDAEAWSMLARSYTAMGRFQEALPAYKRVYELRPQDAQALVDYADGLAVLNNRSLQGEPEKLINQALKLDPQNLKALALAGTVSFTQGDYAGALKHWERAVALSEPGGEFARQMQGAMDEARRRSRAPAVPPAPAAAASSATVAGRVSLGAALKGQVSPDDTVFIFARAPGGSRMPLAILRKKVADLPLDFQLDDTLAMSPAARLSSAAQVVVGARISKSGNAMPAPGDWQVISAPVALGAKGLQLEIAEPVR